MNFIKSRNTHTIKIMALLTMVFAIAAVPTSASAGSSIHLSLPNLSIGFHDNHNRNYYNNQRRHNNYGHRSHRNNRYYNSKRHYNDYDSGYNYYQPQSRYYQPRRYDNHCPDAGYSSRHYRNRDCYTHGDHFHCDN